MTQVCRKIFHLTGTDVVLEGSEMASTAPRMVTAMLQEGTSMPGAVPTMVLVWSHKWA